MTAQNRTTLKGNLEDGDTFDQTIAGDMVDSDLNLIETTVQTMAGELKGPKFHATTEVSSPTIKGSAAVLANVTASSVNAASVSADTLFVGGSEVLAAGAGAGGSLYIAGTAVQDIGVAGTFIAASGTFTQGSTLVQFSAETNGVLKYTGTTPKNFHIESHLSVQAAANSKLTSMRIGVNASAIATTEIDRFVGTGADTGAVTLGAFVSVNTSAEIQVFLANKTDTVNLELHKMILMAHQV